MADIKQPEAPRIDAEILSTYFKGAKSFKRARSSHGRHAMAKGAGSLPKSEGGTPPLHGNSPSGAGTIFKQSKKEPDNNGLFAEFWYDDGTDANGQFIEKQKKSNSRKARVKFADPSLKKEFPRGFPASGKDSPDIDDIQTTSGPGSNQVPPGFGRQTGGIPVLNKETDAGEAVNWGADDLGGSGNKPFLSPEFGPSPYVPRSPTNPPGVTPPGGIPTPTPAPVITGVTPSFGGPFGGPSDEPQYPDFVQTPIEDVPLSPDVPTWTFEDDDVDFVIVPPLTIVFEDNIQDVDPWEVSYANMATITDYWLLTGASISHEINNNTVTRTSIETINTQHDDEELYNFDRISYRDIESYDGSVIRPSVFYEEASGARLFYDSSASTMVQKFQAAATEAYGGGDALSSGADAATLRSAATGLRGLEYGLFEGAYGDIANGIAIGYVEYENSVYDIDPLESYAFINTAKLFFHTSEVPDPNFTPASMESTWAPWGAGDSMGEYSITNPWTYQAPERIRLDSKFGYDRTYAGIDVKVHVRDILNEVIVGISNDLASDIFTRTDSQNVIMGGKITANVFEKITDKEIPEYATDADLQELISSPGEALMSVSTTVTGAPSGGTYDASSVIGSGDTGATTVVTSTGASY